MPSPSMSEKTFESLVYTSGEPMSVTGTVSKSAILLALTIATATVSWNAPASMAMPLVLGGAIGGLILALITIFKKPWSPVTAPIYALFEGLFLGAISAMYNMRFEGIVLQAVMLSFGVLAAMLFLYQTGVIKVTQTFRMCIVAATGAVALVYLISIVMGFFGKSIPMIHEGGTVGIVFSLVVVGIAAMNFALDFDLIDQGVSAGAPRYMEWYCAFGLLMTLIWLYLEILRLLSKLNRR